MATFHDSTTLPETRTALEALIEAAIARLDELDGDPDDEPCLGSPSREGPPNLDFASWAAHGDFYCDTAASQAHWADGGDVGEREETCEDEGAACEDEGAEDEREPSLGALERVCQLQWAWQSSGGIDCERTGDEDDFDYRRTGFDYAAEQAARQRVVEAAQAAVEDLRTVQRRAGQKPAQQLRVLCGVIMR